MPKGIRYEDWIANVKDMLETDYDIQFSITSGDWRDLYNQGMSALEAVEKIVNESYYENDY